MTTLYMYEPATESALVPNLLSRALSPSAALPSVRIHHFCCAQSQLAATVLRGILHSVGLLNRTEDVCRVRRIGRLQNVPKPRLATEMAR